MSSPITWQNIAGPNLGDALRSLAGAQGQINSAFGQADKLWGNVLSQQENEKQQAYLDLVGAVKSEQDLAALQASGQLDSLKQGMNAETRAKVRFADEQRLQSLLGQQDAALKRSDASTAREMLGLQNEQARVKHQDFVATEAEKPAMAGINQLVLEGKFDEAKAVIGTSDLRETSKATALAGINAQISGQAEAARKIKKGDIELASATVGLSNATIEGELKKQAFKDGERDRLATQAADKALVEWQNKRPDMPIGLSPEGQAQRQREIEAYNKTGPQFYLNSYLAAGGSKVNADALVVNRSDNFLRDVPIAGQDKQELEFATALTKSQQEAGILAERKRNNVFTAVNDKFEPGTTANRKVMEEARLYVGKEITLKDAKGNPLKDKSGKPIKTEIPQEIIINEIRAANGNSGLIFDGVDSPAWFQSAGSDFKKRMDTYLNSPEGNAALLDYLKGNHDAINFGNRNNLPGIVSRALFNPGPDVAPVNREDQLREALKKK